MRKKFLAVAITATLSTMNLAYAGGFVNQTDSDCYKKITGNNVTQDAVPCTTAITASGTIMRTDAGTTINSTGIVTNGYVPTSSSSEPIIYGTHLFGGSGGASVILPSGTDVGAIVKYSVTGSIGFTFDFDVSLENAKFSGEPEITLDTSSGTQPTSIQKKATSSAGASNYGWTIEMPDNGKIVDGDILYVAYKLKEAQALKDAGKTVTMTARLGSIFLEIDKQELIVARSAAPVEVELENATQDGRIRISVTSGNKEFDAKDSTNEFITNAEVIIGYLTINNVANVFSDSGVHEWSLGNTDTATTTAGGDDAFGAGYDIVDGDPKTTLVIEAGQFAASVSDSSAAQKGRVYLRNLTTGTEIAKAEQVTTDAAVFQLSDSELKDIAAQGRVAIVIMADGITPINLPPLDDGPNAYFVLDYAETGNVQDLRYPGANDAQQLRRIKQDGTVCWVYNVPGSAAIDNFNLRITNDSSTSGTVNGTLYDGTGTAIFTGLNVFGKDVVGTEIPLLRGETKRITAVNLENLEGGPYTWTGRALLHLTSTLPKLEIMALLRSKLPGAPLTNLSVGAHGSACTN